jgi:hypothetical protein
LYATVGYTVCVRRDAVPNNDFDLTTVVLAIATFVTIIFVVFSKAT